MTLALALALALAGPPAAQPADTAPRAVRWSGTVSRPVGGSYFLTLPRGYGRSGARWPLILYLHGGSMRGVEPAALPRGGGVPRVALADSAFPFIVVAPVLPPGRLWTDTDALVALLDDVQRRYAVDPARVYLTGHSMGGNGAWYLAYQHPERFAAVAPMSGPANPWWATRLRGMPVWAFHGDADSVVALRETTEMADALRAAGGDVRISVLPGRGHAILDVYEDPALYRWLLAHRRR